MWLPGWKQGLWGSDVFCDRRVGQIEEAAVEDAITDLARRIVERTVEDW